MSWDKDMTPEQTKQWDDYVAHFRESTIKQMAESAFVMQLVPQEGKFDVKFATELGASIMLDKPILAVVMPGAAVPSKLRLIADEIVECDIDTEEGRKSLTAAIARIRP